MPRDRADDQYEARPLAGAERARVVANCDRLQGEILDLDLQAQELVRKRREAVAELRANRRRLWAVRAKWGRQPAQEGGIVLPPVAADAHWLAGRRLRMACRILLSLAGTALSLVELHVLLHRHHFAVAGRQPVKVLADALGYDVDGGRCRRVRRGVYDLDPALVGTLKREVWPGGPIIGPLPPA